MKALNGLDPAIRCKAWAFYGKAMNLGIELLVYEGRRSFMRQGEMHAQGRTIPGRKVTNAAPGQSYHNYGLAFDCVEMAEDGSPLWDETPWDKLGTLGKSVGLSWGGDWRTFKDRPHFENSEVHWTTLKALAPDGHLPEGWNNG
jgi:peptidoglycan L-alanyl-D-glutamate endopeptidase CwlK